MELFSSKIKSSSYIFRKWNFLALILGSFQYFFLSFFYIFSKESFSYISGIGNGKKLFVFQEVFFLAQKVIQKNSLKNFLYFGKWNFLTPRLKISFLGGTSKVPKTKIYTSLNLSEEIHRIKCQYNHDEKKMWKLLN